METRILEASRASGDGRVDPMLVGRRSLLLGLGGSALGTACGDGGMDESGETIGSSADAFNWVAPANVSFASVPRWSGTTIGNFFTYVRDLRWLRMAGSNFQRRLSWLYPDSGCEARAEVMVHRAAISLLPKPYKLFVQIGFGQLRLNTNNHPDGFVEWGVHAAPVVRNSTTNKAFVLDPCVDPVKPLLWNTWFSRLNPNASAVVAVMDPTWYSPLGHNPSSLDHALGELQNDNGWLELEWARQIELGRNPSAVLGNSPPW